MIERIEWDWGDGLTDHQWMPAHHTFAADGSYTVSVEVEVAPGPYIFADGFEAGGDQAWSMSTP